MGVYTHNSKLLFPVLCFGAIDLSHLHPDFFVHFTQIEARFSYPQPFLNFRSSFFDRVAGHDYDEEKQFHLRNLKVLGVEKHSELIVLLREHSQQQHRAK